MINRSLHCCHILACASKSQRHHPGVGLDISYHLNMFKVEMFFLLQAFYLLCGRGGSLWRISFPHCRRICNILGFVQQMKDNRCICNIIIYCTTNKWQQSFLVADTSVSFRIFWRLEQQLIFRVLDYKLITMIFKSKTLQFV